MTVVENAVAVLGPILPGSIIVIPEGILTTGLDPDDTEAWAAALNSTLDQLEKTAGHRQFVVLTVSPDDPPVAVFGIEKLRELVHQIIDEDYSTR